MKQKSTLGNLAGLVLTMLLLCALPLMAQKNTRRPVTQGAWPRKAAPLAIQKAAGDVKYAYGVLSFDYTYDSYANGLVRFPFTEGAGFSFVTYFGLDGYDVTAGAYADDYYYAELTQTDEETQAMIPVELVCYDIESNQMRTVGDLSGYTSHINDMSYDYSTGTMYAISVRDGAYSVLYTISLKNAESTEVATLDRRFFTLACSYDGQLYGISFDGDFCKIDKTTGAVEVVGATGWHPTYYQSMEFDHTDNTLYWAANLMEGTDNDDCIATVDLNTGAATKVAAVGDYPQIAGLYIPFSASAKGTPAAVQNFVLTPGAKGASNATLAWTNPTTTFDGLALAAISNVKVYRDHRLIKTFTDAAPGQAMTYTDELGSAKGAVHHYTVYASNEVGKGAQVKDFAFVGRDIPAGVTDLKLTTADNLNVSLSWSQPAEGVSGGYVDMSSLTYTVVRNPDKKVVAQGIKDTHATDLVKDRQLYSYTVTATNADGESQAVTSAEQALGPMKTLPAKFDFTDINAENSWTAADADGDGNTWMWTENASSKVLAHQPSDTAPSDDWLMGYYMPFEKDVTYRLDFNYRARSNDSLQVFIVKSLDHDTPLQRIDAVKINGSEGLQHYSVTFKAQESGNFNIALRALSPMRADWLELYSLSLRKADNTDLAAIGISGPGAPEVGKESVYTVKVENQGLQSISGFGLALKDQNGAVLAAKTFDTTLKGGESTAVQIAWTPASTATTGICAQVSLADGPDDYADDDTTPMLGVTVRGEFSGTMVKIGTDTKYKNQFNPFAICYGYGAALNIYSADEVGTGDKNIVKIAWPYEAEGQADDATDVPVRVYMCNTDRTDTYDRWIPEDEMTLVYDGTVDIAKQSKGDLTLTLTKPFAYAGGKNLGVLTVVNCDQYISNVNFYAYLSPMQGNVAWTWASYSTPGWFDFSQWGHQDYYGEVASVLLYMTDAAGIGSVAAAAGQPGSAYTVYTTDGRQVADGVFAADGSIDTGALANGIYVVAYKAAGKQQSMKISVRK